MHAIRTVYSGLITLLQIWLCYGSFDPNAVTHTTKAELTSRIGEGNHEILIFFYTKFDECPECKEKMPIFHEAVEYLEKLEEGKIKSYKLAVKFPEYDVTSFPQLILFLGHTPFRYDKMDDFTPDSIVDWVEEAKQTPFPELTDETFEHLTQSSTGATTGDWLIMFADSKRPDCMKPNLPNLAATAVRLRRRKNVATVDTSKSPITTKRFGMQQENHCVKILLTKPSGFTVTMSERMGIHAQLLFHRTDLYHYDSDDRSASALLDFVLKEYANSEALTVPSPVDHKSEKLENTINALKELFSEHEVMSQLTFIGGVGIGLSAVFVAVLFILRKFRKRKMN